MRPTFSIALLWFALFASTCMAPAYGCNLSDGKGVEWPDVLQCGPKVDDLVSTVSTILLGSEKPGDEGSQTAIGQRAKDELEQLAEKHGANVISCLVDLLKRDWTRPGASATPETLAAAARAQSFLDVEGVQVTKNEAYEP
jgi:hypothetical protein